MKCWQFFLDIHFVSSFSTSATKFSELDAGIKILFQIKLFSRNTKEATLARYFIKLTTRPSFPRLRFIRRKNRIH